MPGPTNPSQVRHKHRGMGNVFARGSIVPGVYFRSLSIESAAWGSNLLREAQLNTLPGMPPGVRQVRLYRTSDGYGNFLEGVVWPSTMVTFWYYVREGINGGPGTPINQIILRNNNTSTNVLAFNWNSWGETVTITTNNAGAGNAEAGIEHVPGSRHWRLVWGRVKGGFSPGQEVRFYASSGGVFYNGDEIYTHSPGAYPGWINPLSEIPHNPRPW